MSNKKKQCVVSCWVIKNYIPFPERMKECSHYDIIAMDLKLKCIESHNERAAVCGATN